MKYPMLMSQKEAANMLGFSTRTLERWRWEGGGPPFVAISARCIRYRQADLEKWIESRVQPSIASDEVPR